MQRKDILIIAIIFIQTSCIPWDFRFEPRMETERYSESTRYDRAVRRILLQNRQILVAGAAKIDITPPQEKWVYMAGYNAGRRSTGVMDPITARCAFLSNGSESILFISLDLIGYFYDDIREVREMISKDENLSKKIIISSVHNHEGPDTLGLWGPGPFSIFPVKNGRNPKYDNWLKNRITRCAFEAVENVRTATLKFAKIDVPEGYQENLRKHGYKENTMYLMLSEGVDGKGIFTLANYPIHIEALDEENHLISADIAGAMYNYYEKNQDGILLFTQGSLGGMVVPKISKWAPQSEKRRFKDIVGKALAISALKGLESNSVNAKEPVVIEHRFKKIELNVENTDFEVAHKLGVLKREIKDKKMPTEIHYVRIGEAIFVTVPGESLPELGFEINKIIPSEYKFKINLGMDEIGYILPESYFNDPLYDYEKSMSLGPETAKRVFETIKELIENR
ncbi:MAG: hypothetical protein ACP5KG_00290 [Myxococcota bacterium]